MSTGPQSKTQLGIVVLAGVLIVVAFVLGRSQQPDIAPKQGLGISIGDFKRAIQGAGLFSGGPERKYEDVGRQTFAVSVSQGLMPDHKVLDIGAGSLRIGWWYLHYIRPENTTR